MTTLATDVQPWAGMPRGSVPAPPHDAVGMPEQVRPLAAALTDALERRSAHRREVVDATAAVKKAGGLDVQATAQAMRAGKADPGPRHATTAATALADARRRRDAADAVVDTAVADYVAAIVEHADTWTASLDAAHAAAATALRSALADVATAVDRIADTHALRETIEAATTRRRLSYKRTGVQVGGTQVAVILDRLAAVADTDD